MVGSLYPSHHIRSKQCPAAQAIGSMLEAQGAAPELISLDLRDNNFTPAGLERLVRCSLHRQGLPWRL